MKVGHDFVIEGSPGLPVRVRRHLRPDRRTRPADHGPDGHLGIGIGNICAGTASRPNTIGRDLVVTGNHAVVRRSSARRRSASATTTSAAISCSATTPQSRAVASRSPERRRPRRDLRSEQPGRHGQRAERRGTLEHLRLGIRGARARRRAGPRAPQPFASPSRSPVTTSLRSAVAVSRPGPQSTTSRWLSRAWRWSSPAPPNRLVAARAADEQVAAAEASAARRRRRGRGACRRARVPVRVSALAVPDLVTPRCSPDRRRRRRRVAVVVAGAAVAGGGGGVGVGDGRRRGHAPPPTCRRRADARSARPSRASGRRFRRGRLARTSNMCVPPRERVARPATSRRSRRPRRGGTRSSSPPRTR